MLFSRRVEIVLTNRFRSLFPFFFRFFIFFVSFFRREAERERPYSWYQFLMLLKRSFFHSIFFARLIESSVRTLIFE